MQRTRPSLERLWLVLLGVVLSIASPASAALIMRIDSANKFFYIDGSDTGNGADSGFNSYDLQFSYGFSAQPSASEYHEHVTKPVRARGDTADPVWRYEHDSR